MVQPAFLALVVLADMLARPNLASPCQRWFLFS